MKSYKLALAFVCAVVLVLATAAGAVAAPHQAVVHEVYPTGDPTQDVQNVQAAIDNAADGDTILLVAGTFNFGDWKTNPIPEGYVVIDKGVTVTGDGFDGSGNPRTIVQGGGYRQKGHWETGEHGVFGFSGDTSGGVLQNLWLKEPHFLGINSNGSFGDHHRSFAIRNVKITDVSHDIPAWDPYESLGRSISIGFALPEWGLGGPSGTVVIEGCDISHMGSTLDPDYIDPDTGELYYRDPEGGDLALHDSRAINTFICSRGSFVIRNNKIRAQSAGIVNEAMGGAGDIIVTGNDIYVENVGLPKPLRRGYVLEGLAPFFAPTPFARTVRIENNNVHVVGDPDEGYTAGMVLGSDVGVEGYDGHITVKDNTVVMGDGNGALILGTDRGPDWVSVLTAAVIRNNRIRGAAQYGMLSVSGAQYCNIYGNNLATFEPSVAHIGFYGPAVHDNTVSGYSGVVIVADGAYNNAITGYTPMSP
jgi:hypothetical protein